MKRFLQTSVRVQSLKYIEATFEVRKHAKQERFLGLEVIVGINFNCLELLNIYLSTEMH